MNPQTWCIFVQFCLLLPALSAPPGLLMLDAPGPGYREQAAMIRASTGSSPGTRTFRALRDPRPFRFDSSESAQSARRKPSVQEDAMSRRLDAHEQPLSLRAEIRHLNGTLPDLLTENPFAHPIRLFGSSGSALEP